jgi:hypothetical protein
MMQWTTNRVNPAVAARTAMPGMTRQATTAAPIGSRSQLRTRDMTQRNAPAQRGATKAADEDDDKKDDDDRESLFSRDEPTDEKDDTNNDEKLIGHDPEEDDDGNENIDPKDKRKKAA